MAKLTQTAVADTRLGTRARTIDVDTLSCKGVDANQVRIERRFKRRPTGVLAEETQDNFEPIIAKRMRPYHLSCKAAQGPLALGHPGLDMDEPVLSSRENGTQPDRRDSTYAETLPVSMHRERVVKKPHSSHPVHLRQQQRDVIDTLSDYALYLIHPQSLTQSAISLQI
jgi:hypothetical protein